ncbi:MAG: SDR family oxidoreductase [Aphanocapsa sp. GSE-SYN-MK-11-07L]|jgi:nucleoside-diphosphate-sugar epimerase|nr:SDR family oxidoreductase [Aphanocapsa sp. GSE-SYN-MK-11-07L]
MKALILGCGYTGSHLARRLQAQGVTVNITTQSGIAPAGVSAACFAFSCDSAGGKFPLTPEALQGVTHVLTTIPPDRQGIDPVVHCLLSDLERLKLTWFGYLSTTGVYGDTHGAWVDETTPTNPQHGRSRQRVAAETSLLKASLPTHIFRLPGIYGLGRNTFDRLRAGKAQRIDRPGHVFSRVHVDDIVQTLWRSMQQPTPGEIYNICDDQPSEASSLITEAAELLGIQPPDLIPFSQVQMSPMAASFWSECRRVSNRKIKDKLGVQLLYPTYREGLREIRQQELAS